MYYMLHLTSIGSGYTESRQFPSAEAAQREVRRQVNTGRWLSGFRVQLDKVDSLGRKRVVATGRVT